MPTALQHGQSRQRSISHRSMSTCSSGAPVYSRAMSDTEFSLPFLGMQQGQNAAQYKYLKMCEGASTIQAAVRP